jgi:CRP-like cAMP-binding protein
MHEEILNHFMTNSKLFNLLDEAGRQRLVGMAIPDQFEQGQEILKEGDTGESFYVLTTGKIRISAEGFDGDQHLADLGPGAVFGEIAALNAEPRTATVIATEPASAVRFERPNILLLLQDYPKMRQMLNRIGLMRSEDALQKILEN